MCCAVVYHCETPVAESWRTSNPLPQAGRRDRSKPMADGASSVPPSLSCERRRGGASAGGGTGPGPHHRCQEKGWDSGEALLGGCWAGTGAISAPRSPLSAPQWWSPALSLPVLAPSHSHAQEVLWAYIPPLPPPSNKFRHPKTRQSSLTAFPSRKEQTLKVQSTVTEVCVCDPQRANSGVVLTQAFSSAGHDKLLGWPRHCRGANTTTLLPSALALSPAATRQRGSAVYLAVDGIQHDGKSLWRGWVGGLRRPNKPPWPVPAQRTLVNPIPLPPAPRKRPGHSNRHWVIIIISRRGIAGPPRAGRHPCFTECFVFYCL